MRAIFLNTYNGRLGDELIRFIEKTSKGTDIYCLQETDEEIFKKIKRALPGFNAGVVSKHISKILYFAVSFFINTKYMINSEKRILDGNPHIGLAEMYVFSDNDKKFAVSNVHGIPDPADKKDNPSRILQSDIILMNNMKSNLPRIIGGDFNLLPDTESIKKFERSGFRNLIKEFGIKTTRNHVVWDREKDSLYGYFGKQYFADYVFVSPEVKVKNFEVPDVEISDHLPMILDFEI